MKQKKICQKLIMVAFTILISLSNYAQEFTLTTTNANISGYRALMNVPGLSGNPLAIILVTPLGSTASLNPHPIGAYYNEAKWCIMNLDQASMIPGLSFKVQYWLTPGPSQFMHKLTPQNMGAEGSYIDNPALNNKPTTQFKIFQNYAPEIRGGLFNRYETTTGYNSATGKWYITNVNHQPLETTSAYNIIISAEGKNIRGSDPIPIDNASVQPCKCPVSLPPNGPASGDLTGTYPDPMVRKILGRPLSNTAPVTGQVLKWNGTEWMPSNESGGNATTYTAAGGIQLEGTLFTALYETPMWNASKFAGRSLSTIPPKVGQVLKWGGGAWYPANDSVGNNSTNNLGSSVNPLYNNTQMLTGWSSQTLTPGQSVITNQLPGLVYTYYLTTNAKVMVSFSVPAITHGCIGCGSTGVFLFLHVNRSVAQRFYWEIANNSSLVLSGSYLLSLPPGEQKIELMAKAVLGPSVSLGYTATQSTMIIQVIPQ